MAAGGDGLPHGISERTQLHMLALARAAHHRWHRETNDGASVLDGRKDGHGLFNSPMSCCCCAAPCAFLLRWALISSAAATSVAWLGLPRGRAPVCASIQFLRSASSQSANADAVLAGVSALPVLWTVAAS